MDKAAMTRLSREAAHIQKTKIPHIAARPSSKDLLIWHFVLHDLPQNSAYFGGVYHGKLVFPKEYPLKPPAIYMITPSGRFEVNSRLCLSMSDFHPESWNPSWRIESILVGLLSFMLDPQEPRTTGGMHKPYATRRQMALASFEFNRKNKEYLDLFPEYSDEEKVHEGLGFFTDSEPPKDAASAEALNRSKGGDPKKAGGGAGAAGGLPGEGRENRAGQQRGLISVRVALGILALLAPCLLAYVLRGGVGKVK